MLLLLLCFSLRVNSEVSQELRGPIVGTNSTLDNGLAMIQMLNTKLYFQMTLSFLNMFSSTEAGRSVNGMCD